MKNMKRIALVVAITLLLGCAIGGTLAWLTDKTDTVTNTFTSSDVDIELNETWNTDTNGDNKNDAWKAKMVPGITLSKDPTVTVSDDSEDCYVFIKVEESGDITYTNAAGTSVTKKFADYLDYDIDTEVWTVLDATKYPGVYYREVAATDELRVLNVLLDQKVNVNTTVDKEMMNALTNDNYPELTFTAYAIQKNYLKDNNNAEVTTAQGAWELVKPAQG